jgi:predicted dehydrogenase
MSVLLIGAGPMAIAYGKVLNGLGVPWSAIGRSTASAEKFESETSRRPELGGFEAHLADHPSLSEAAMIVALPVPALAGATKALIENGGRKILVEKPAGLTTAEIADLARTVSLTKAEVFVAYNRRFYGSVSAARGLIAEDGGVTSFHMEFTERVDQILGVGHDAGVLRNWLLANSSHVTDLAFYLAGDPVEASGLTQGALDWHPGGAVFVGHGRTKSGTIFSWHADWTSAGRWSLDLRTRRRRLILQPLESLAVQEKGSFAISQHPIDEDLDRRYKPGLYRQVEAFLSTDPAASGLPTIAAHLDTVQAWLPAVRPQGSALKLVAGETASGDR